MRAVFASVCLPTALQLGGGIGQGYSILLHSRQYNLQALVAL